MPTPSDHPANSGAFFGDLLTFLAGLQNPDGGWAFHSAAHSRVEPTCWAVFALSGSRRENHRENLQKGVQFLQAAQREDGSWPAADEMSAGGWVTSLACLALQINGAFASAMAAGLQWLCDDFPRDSSPWRRLLSRMRGDSQISEMNDSYRGWGWTPRTSSWVEPTSFALLALAGARPQHLPANAAKRRELATALLYDRMCPGGGWNCGNPRVYGVDGEALVLPTCWALLALRDAPEKPGRALSLGWLQKEFAKIEGAGSLAVAAMTLQDFEIGPEDAGDGLSSWSAEELAAQGAHVLSWVCLALDPQRVWPVNARSDAEPRTR